MGVRGAWFRIAIAMGVVAPSLASAQDEPTGWHLFGSNEIVVEDFDVDGDRTASPYQFDGTFWTDRLSLDLGWLDGIGHRFTLRTELLGADNDYLAEDGAVIEVFKLAYENGVTAVPFRVEAGDFFGDFSRRTLQRAVRGASLELQPQTAGTDHSLVLLAATGEPSWSDTFDGSASDLGYSGLSYLFAPRSGRASLGASVVAARARPQAALAQPLFEETDQTVASLSGSAALGAGARLEGEVAHLESDPEDRPSESDDSFYLQLGSAGDRSLSWKLRVEDNGETFLPVGAVGIIANRSSGEGQARYSFASRGYLSANLQEIHDRVEGALPQLDTRIAGLTYEGQPSMRRPSFRLRVAGDWNDLEAEDRSLLQDFQHYGLEASELFGGRWELAYASDYWDVDDEINASGARRSLDQRLTLGLHAMPAEGANLLVRLGGMLRRQTETAEFETVSPILDLETNWGPHRFAVHLSFLEQDFEAVTTRDLEYTEQGMVYSFERGAHAFSLEAARDLREPDGALETDSLRLAMRYRYSFERRWGA